MNGLQKHIIDLKPARDHPGWDPAKKMLLSILEMYMQKDIWTVVSDDTKFGMCKKKWKELK